MIASYLQCVTIYIDDSVDYYRVSLPRILAVKTVFNYLAYLYH